MLKIRSWHTIYPVDSAEIKWRVENYTKEGYYLPYNKKGGADVRLNIVPFNYDKDRLTFYNAEDMVLTLASLAKNEQSLHFITKKGWQTVPKTYFPELTSDLYKMANYYGLNENSIANPVPVESDKSEKQDRNNNGQTLPNPSYKGTGWSIETLKKDYWWVGLLAVGGIGYFMLNGNKSRKRK